MLVVVVVTVLAAGLAAIFSTTVGITMVGVAIELPKPVLLIEGVGVIVLTANWLAEIPTLLMGLTEIVLLAKE